MVRSLAVTVSCVLVSASLAQAAATISTPPVQGGLPGMVGARCVVVNVGTKDAEVTVEIIEGIGGTVAESVGPSTVAPGVRTGATIAITDATYCRVTGLSKKTGTVTHYAQDGSGNALMTVTAP